MKNRNEIFRFKEFKPGKAEFLFLVPQEIMPARFSRCYVASISKGITATSRPSGCYASLS